MGNLFQSLFGGSYQSYNQPGYQSQYAPVNNYNNLASLFQNLLGSIDFGSIFQGLMRGSYPSNYPSQSSEYQGSSSSGYPSQSSEYQGSSSSGYESQSSEYQGSSSSGYESQSSSDYQSSSSSNNGY